MRLNKRIDWFRVVPAAALGAVLGGGACNNNPNPNPNPTPGGGNFTAAPATTSGAYSLPLDTVPSKDGSTFYFIAMGKNGMGIFKVAASGGAATEIVSGAPLVGPTSLSISSDDATLYIADPAAGEDETDPTKPKLGGIFSLSTGGGTEDGEELDPLESLGEIEHAYEVSEDRAVLAPGFRALDDRERTILHLRFFEGLTQSQIAQQVGISQMHVSRLIRRALEKIREEIAADELDPDRAA